MKARYRFTREKLVHDQYFEVYKYEVHSTMEILKTQQSLVILDLCLRKTPPEKSLDYRDFLVFEKPRFQNIFRLKEKPAFQFPPVLRAFSKKLRFRDGLVWTVGLTVEIMLWFQLLYYCTLFTEFTSVLKKEIFVTYSYGN